MKFELEIRKKDMDIVKRIADYFQVTSEWDFDKRKIVKRKRIDEYTYRGAIKECFIYLFDKYSGYGDQRKNIKVKRIK